jgi:hypothetical protein
MEFPTDHTFGYIPNKLNEDMNDLIKNNFAREWHARK